MGKSARAVVRQLLKRATSLAAIFLSGRLLLSLSLVCVSRPEATRLFVPTDFRKYRLANIARRGLFLDIQKTIRKQQQRLTRGFSKQIVFFHRRRVRSSSSIARGREIYTIDYSRSVLWWNRGARRHERGILMSRGEYEWRAKTYTRNVFLTHITSSFRR